MDPFRLDGRTALVTGAGRGLGRGIALGLAAAAFAGLRRLDILVNNAGVNRPQPFLAVDAATLDRMIDLNIRAVFRCAQAAARLMVAGGGGVIVNMSSQMGHVGSERDR